MQQNHKFCNNTMWLDIVLRVCSITFLHYFSLHSLEASFSTTARPRCVELYGVCACVCVCVCRWPPGGRWHYQQVAAGQSRDTHLVVWHHLVVVRRWMLLGVVRGGLLCPRRPAGSSAGMWRWRAHMRILNRRGNSGTPIVQYKTPHQNWSYATTFDHPLCYQ